MVPKLVFIFVLLSLVGTVVYRAFLVYKQKTSVDVGGKKKQHSFFHQQSPEAETSTFFNNNNFSSKPTINTTVFNSSLLLHQNHKNHNYDKFINASSSSSSSSLYLNFNLISTPSQKFNLRRGSVSSDLFESLSQNVANVNISSKSTFKRRPRGNKNQTSKILHNKYHRLSRIKDSDSANVNKQANANDIRNELIKISDNMASTSAFEPRGNISLRSFTSLFVLSNFSKAFNDSITISWKENVESDGSNDGPHHFWFWFVGVSLHATYAVMPPKTFKIVVNFPWFRFLDSGTYAMYVLYEYNSSIFHPLGSHIHNCPIVLKHIGQFVGDAGPRLLTIENSVALEKKFPAKICEEQSPGRWTSSLSFPSNATSLLYNLPTQEYLLARKYIWKPYSCNYVQYTKVSAAAMLLKHGIRKVFFAGDSLIEGLATASKSFLKDRFGGFKKSHSLCQKQQKAHTIFAYYAAQCHKVRCVLVAGSGIHDVIGMLPQQYRNCISSMLQILRKLPGLVIWKDICDAHRHQWSGGVCSIQFMTHERIHMFNNISAEIFNADSSPTRLPVPILQTYGITQASYGLVPNDIRHYRPVVNNVFLNVLLNLIDFKSRKKEKKFTN